LAQYQAAETMAHIAAERLAEHLEQSGFVIMCRPIPVGDGGNNPGARTRILKAGAISAGW
jgi:hypothetical protein